MADEMQYLKVSIESHDRQIGELTDRLAEQAANLEKLIVVAHDLVIIARSHEERLDNGGPVAALSYPIGTCSTISMPKPSSATIRRG